MSCSEPRSVAPYRELAAIAEDIPSLPLHERILPWGVGGFLVVCLFGFSCSVYETCHEPDPMSYPCEHYANWAAKDAPARCAKFFAGAP